MITVQDAVAALYEITTCTCSPAWTDRGLHDTNCVAEYREYVDVLAEVVYRMEALER